MHCFRIFIFLSIATLIVPEDYRPTPCLQYYYVAYSSPQKTFDNSHFFCQDPERNGRDQIGNLASIHDTTLLEELWGLCDTEQVGQFCWVGLESFSGDDKTTPLSYSWTDGSPNDLQDDIWDDGYPGGSCTNNSRCAGFFAGIVKHKLHSGIPSNEYGFICQFFCPSPAPTAIPTPFPTVFPSPVATQIPSPSPSSSPTMRPSAPPTAPPTSIPTSNPTSTPTAPPTSDPTGVPTSVPTDIPTSVPTDVPTDIPTAVPTDTPTSNPTSSPSPAQTSTPTMMPTKQPTQMPTECPTVTPTNTPTLPPVPVPTPISTQTPALKLPLCSNAEFWTTGDGIFLDFDIPTNKGNLMDHSFGNCQALFDEATIRLFGDNPVCGWESSTRVTVACGPVATVMPVALNSSLSELHVIGEDVASLHSASLFETCSINVTRSSNEESPNAALTVPNTIGSCTDSIELDGRSSSGFAGRTRSYLWSSNCSVDLKAETDTSYQNIDFNNVPAESVCQFALVVRNFLGLSSEPSYQHVLKIYEMIPQVKILGAQVTSWRRSEHHDLSADITIGSCGDGDNQFSFEWTGLSVDGTEIVNIPENSYSNCRISAYSLQVGQEYEFILSVFSSAPDPVRASVFVTAVSSGVVAEISGSEIRQVYAQQPLFLSAAKSRDLDIDPSIEEQYLSLEFTWACAYFNKSDDLDVALSQTHPPDGNWLSCTENIPDPTAMEIELSELSPLNTYSFTVEVAADVRGAADSVIVIPIDAQVPEVSIEGRKLLNINQKLSLTAVIRGATEPVTYRWEETQYSSLQDDRVDALRNTEKGEKNLVLEAGGLLPNRNYIFQLSATDIHGTGTGATTVKVDPGPNIEDFRVTLLTVAQKQASDSINDGTALLDTYLLETLVDGSLEILPFQFSFAYYHENSEDSLILAGPQSQSVATVRLPEGTLTLVACVEDSIGGVSFKEYPTQITVSALPEICELEKYANELLPDAIAEKNLDATLQILETIAMMLNDESFDVCESEGLKNDLFFMLQQAWKTQSVHPIGQAQHLAQILVALMEDVESLTIDQLWIAMELVDDIFIAVEESKSEQQDLALTSLLVSILSFALEADVQESEDKYCDVVLKIQEHIQTLLTSQLDLLIADENPLNIEAGNIIATALKVDQGDDPNVKLSGFLSLELDITGDPDASSSNTTSVTVSRVLLPAKCYCGGGGACPDDDTIIEIITNDNVTSIVFVILISTNTSQENPAADAACFDEDYVNETSKCGWWNETGGFWSVEGCESTIILVEGTEVGEAIQCNCTHLTKFAVIKDYKEVKANPCAGDPLLDIAFIIVFVILYGILALFSIIRIFSALRYTGTKHFRLSDDVSVHLLVIIICVCQMVWLLLYQAGSSAVAISILVVIPTAALYSVFAFVIYSWGKICHKKWNSAVKNNLTGLKYTFIILVTIVTAILIVWLVIFIVEPVDSMMFKEAFLICQLIISAISIATALGFVIYGGLLIKKLKSQDDYMDKKSVAKGVRKIFLVSLILSSTFVAESVITMLSVLLEDQFVAKFLLFQALYFTFDVISLIMVLFIFKNIIESVNTKAESLAHTALKTSALMEAERNAAESLTVREPFSPSKSRPGTAITPIVQLSDIKGTASLSSCSTRSKSLSSDDFNDPFTYGDTPVLGPSPLSAGVRATVGVHKVRGDSF